jgi:hypothetical protein
VGDILMPRPRLHQGVQERLRLLTGETEQLLREVIGASEGFRSPLAAVKASSPRLRPDFRLWRCPRGEQNIGRRRCQRALYTLQATSRVEI